MRRSLHVNSCLTLTLPSLLWDLNVSLNFFFFFFCIAFIVEAISLLVPKLIFGDFISFAKRKNAMKVTIAICAEDQVDTEEHHQGFPKNSWLRAWTTRLELRGNLRPSALFNPRACAVLTRNPLAVIVLYF